MSLIQFVSKTPGISVVARKFWKLYNQMVFSRVEKVVRALTDSCVVKGPFKGLVYPILSASSVHASTTPKLLGMYEKELYADLEKLLTGNNYSRVVVIGAADGFFAVGLTLRLPSVNTIAFEADAILNKELSAVAKANAVDDKIRIKGFCTPELLLGLGSSKRTLIVCDCEGGEIDLMKPEIISALGPCDVIIECHDMFVDNCTEIVQSYFSETHDVTTISSVERNLSDLSPELLAKINLPMEEVEYAIREHRHYTMNWVIAEVK